MTPDISVLLPCFDAARYIEASLESLFSQTYENFEIVAVDDGSEDGTRDLLHNAARTDRRLRVLTGPHRGIASALRQAAAAAHGRLFARMDADDRCHPERLAQQRTYLDLHPEVDVVSSRVRFFPRAGLSDGLLRYERWLNGLLTHDEILRDVFVESPLPHPSILMRRQAYERVGGYRDPGWPEDYDLWMRMAGDGVRFAKHERCLLDWRDRPDRASRVDPRFSAGRFWDLKEHYLLETVLRGKRRIGIWGAGPIGKRWARRLLRRGIEIAYFVDVDPRKIGKRIHGAWVVDAKAIGALGDLYLVVAVAARVRKGSASQDEVRPAREEVRAQLEAARFVERRDFVCVA